MGQLNTRAEIPDDEIDESHTQPLSETLWKNAALNPFYKSIKTHASVPIDYVVMAWLSSEGKGYPTRMNAFLREATLRTHPKA